MRAVVQRVLRARVTVNERIVGCIDSGLAVLVGVSATDGEEDAARLARKVLGLRIFEDADGKMNLDVLAAHGAVLAVSQFTLLGDARKGNRPSFVEAMRPEAAVGLFDRFCAELRPHVAVETGQFGAHMVLSLQNDGPVTILLDTQRVF